MKTTSRSIGKLWRDQAVQGKIYAYLLDKMGFDTQFLGIYIIQILRKKLNSEIKNEFLKLLYLLTLKQKLKENEKTLSKFIGSPLKIFILNYSREEVKEDIDWALKYWIKERGPIPTRKTGKCRVCEYLSICNLSPLKS